MITHREKKGFTLIELLVVIAIIAILAAILFPVFAQAKTAAKKSVAVSNTKQTATAMLIYSTDSDDNFPNAYATDQYGTMLMGPTGPDSYHLAAVPAGWGVNAVWAGADANHWVNSTYPYMKNYELTNCAFTTLYTSGFSYTTAPGGLPTSSASMNGLLSTYSGTAVASPSTTPLVSWGNGKEAYRGYAYTNPIMRCDLVGTASAIAAPCRFNPAGPPQAGMTRSLASRMDTYELTFDSANDTTWVQGDGFVAARTDGSAKFYKQPQTGTNTGNYNQPGYIYSLGRDGANGGGYLDTPLRCQAGTAGAYYQSWYRPDTSGSYAFGATGSGAQCTK